MVTKEKSLEKNDNNDEDNKTQAQEQWFDSTCNCKACDHDLVRDCLKVSCACCKQYDHSMVLNGIEGFPPTGDNTKKIP